MVKEQYNKPIQNNYYTDDVAKNYLKDRVGKKHWKVEESVVKDFINTLSGVKTVLDVPFGTGRFVPLYMEKQLDISGLDISSDMIKEAKKVLQDKFLSCNVRIGTSTNMPYKDDSFDLIVCTRLLSIISFIDTKKTLKEFNRITKKYAILQFGVRNPDNGRERKPYDNERIGKWLYSDEISELLNNSKFSIVTRKPVQTNNYIYLCEKMTDG